MNIICPAPAALAAIPAQSCPFRMDQIVRFAFGRRAVPAFATEAALKLLATWTTLIAAADNTKVVMSPLFAGMVIPGSEGVFVGGGDNTTFNGIRQYQGEANVTVTGTFTNMSPAVKAALDLLTQESLASAVGVSNLEVVMFNKDGFAATKNLDFIPIYNFRLSSRASEGLNANDVHAFSFDMLPDWETGLQMTKLGFDPLTAI